MMLRSSTCSSVGIDKKEAKLLLEFAFINEVIDKMELEPLRDRLHHW